MAFILGRAYLNKNQGFTLIETVISVALLAVASVAFCAGLIYSSRTARAAKTDVFAISVINRMIEDLRSSNYDRLGGNTGTEARFLSPMTFTMNPDAPQDQTVVFTANVRFFGFGTVHSATASTLRATFPSSDAWPAWRNNMFAGRYVMITSGSGRGQIAYIQSNNSNTLTIRRALDGTGNQGWIQSPAAGATFVIDNGKMAEITVTWRQYNRNFTMTRMAMVPSYVGTFS